LPEGECDDEIRFHRANSVTRWRAPLAWLVILSLVTFIVYRNSHPTAAPDETAITIDDIRIQVMGEELIGIKSLGSIAGQLQTAKLIENQQLLISELEATARTTSDKLHIAMIAGEVLGKDQALAKLTAIENSIGDRPSPDQRNDIALLRKIYSSKASALDSSSRNLLLHRHDYFARVALSYGVDAGTEPRKSIEAGGIRATIMLGFAGLAMLLLMLGGFGFFVAAVVLWRKGRIGRAYVPNPSAGTAYLEGFAIYLVLFILGFGLLRRYLGLESLQWEWFALLIIPVVIFWLFRNGSTFEEQRRALGWHTGKGVLREVGAGIAGYLAGIVVMVAGFLVTYLLVKRTGISPEHPLIHILQGNIWHVLGLYALVSVFAPFIEETMFRGALFHHLRRRWGWAITAPVVAFIFAVIHPQGWVAVPVLGSIAIVLAALREWRGSLIAPMVAHACNNFVVLTFALAVLR
jgi:membrane protease YdiL (CAAX protease family)